MFADYRTYIAAFGLIGLSVYQLSHNDVSLALQSFMAALATFGVSNTISNNETAAIARHQSMIMHLQHRGG